MLNKIKFYKQLDKMDCGPVCLKMIAAYHGRTLDLQMLKGYCQINRDGVSLLGISSGAEQIGFQSKAIKGDIKSLLNEVDPCILHWNLNHFVVFYRLHNKKFVVADPAKGIITYSEDEFKEHWYGEDNSGVALILKPSPDFFLLKDSVKSNTGFSRFYRYILEYKKLLFQLFFGFLCGSLIQVFLPFLTQSIVDVGISSKNLEFINLVLIAQFSFLICRTFIEFLRSWILFHISSRLNIIILTDFLGKLLKLPISYFERKATGDILQRMDDHKRIEMFLTGQTLNIGFSTFNLIVFSIILAFYNTQLILIFVLGSIIYGIWIFAFLSRRKEIDYKRFDVLSQSQSATIQLIQGIQEIKLSGSEKKKRWNWERLQVKLFKFNIKSLALGQYQQAGSVFINEGKNLLMIYVVAKTVLSGEMTLGEMIAIQFIIGQLSNPIEQFLLFTQSYQDAKISLERLNEIFLLKNEEDPSTQDISELQPNSDIKIENLTFSYPGGDPVLRKINVNIPFGRTTAIVGASGGGKSTLLKLLLSFYQIHEGTIKIGGIDIQRFSPQFLRMKCGVVTPDSFIFSDTILGNITLDKSPVRSEDLNNALLLACLDEYVKSLPLGVNTMIGDDGCGISQGQRQRILIARAIYKSPDLFLFDEATNSLDTDNEKKIAKNLEKVFLGKTVIIVAHRLSTVRHADNIIVLDKGVVAEQGTHKELILQKGKYYKLVENQLDLSAKDK